jgi:hypothetical protein
MNGGTLSGLGPSPMSSIIVPAFSIIRDGISSIIGDRIRVYDLDTVDREHLVKFKFRYHNCLGKQLYYCHRNL